MQRNIGIDAAQMYEMITAWQQFFSTHDWQELVKSYVPINGRCGIVYELPNFLNRDHESLAVVDMRQLVFTEPHYHPHEDVEVYLILEGSAFVVVGKERSNVHKGSVVVIPPYTAHYVIPDNECVMAVINTPPYTPGRYIALTKSDSSVQFDYQMFKSDINVKLVEG